MSRACPMCGKRNDAMTEVSGSGRTPTPGDVTVCISCGLIETVTETMTLRPMTRTEVEALPHELQVELYRMQREVRRVRWEYAHRN